MKLIFLFCLCLLSLPGFSQEDDDKLINQIEESRRKQGETAQKIETVNDSLKKKVTSFPEELKKLGYDSINSVSLMDEKVVSLVNEAINKRPLKNLTQSQVRALLLEKIKGHKFEKFILNHPNLIDCLVDILRDEKAIPSALGLFLRKDDLKIFGLIWLGILFMGWLFKKIFFNKKWSYQKRIFMGLLIGLGHSLIVLVLFYNIFYEELSPTVAIILKYL
jgi:hypothetical protein